MSLDAKILELRLLIKESSLGQASISKCASKLNTFGKNLSDKSALEAFLRELLLYQLDFEKTKKSFQALSRQNDEYNVLEKEIEGKVCATKDNIARLEEELRQQQSIREHRLECEHVATDVNKQPSRSVLKRKIDAVVNNVDSTNASIELVEAEIAVKEEYFKHVLQAIVELQKAGTVQAEPSTVGEAEDMVGDSNEGDEQDDDDRNTRKHKSDDREETNEEIPVEVDEDGNPIEKSECEEEDEENVEMEDENGEK